MRLIFKVTYLERNFISPSAREKKIGDFFTHGDLKLVPRNKGSDYSLFKIVLARFQSSPSRFMFFSPVPTNCMRAWNWLPLLKHKSVVRKYLFFTVWKNYSSFFYQLTFHPHLPLIGLTNTASRTEDGSCLPCLIPPPLGTGRTEIRLGMTLLPSLRVLHLRESGESLNGGLSIQNRKTMF